MKTTLIALLALGVCVMGCGVKKEPHEPQAKAKGTPKAEPKAGVKQPLTKEEVAAIVEKAIRISIDKPTGELIKADLEEVPFLSLDGNQLTKVPEGLEKLTQLTELGLINNKLTDVKSLEKLTQLKTLHLYNNQLTDVKVLEKLTQLKELNLGRNQLTDVKGLENLTQLTKLHLFDNNLTDVKGLEKLTRLELLNLHNNPALTKAQIAELQEALPNCRIIHNAKK